MNQVIALDEYLMITDTFSCFSLKTYIVIPHLNRLIETVQMRRYNMCFTAELTKVIPNYHQILPLIQSSARYISFSW